TEEAFRIRILSFLLGWIIIFSGVLSAATVALGFAGYFSNLLGISMDIFLIVIAVILIVILGFINFFGIRASTWTNIIFTLIEASGLILIIIIGIPSFGNVNYFVLPSSSSIITIFSTVGLIFFAYIGFEDVANIAEEVKKPSKNLPRAIIISIFITTLLYCFTAISVVSIKPFDTIDPNAPLSDVATTILGPIGGVIMSLIALFATANTVLIMLIVTSRMMYGMARDKALPEGVGKISPKFKTPALAVLLTTIFTIIPLLFGDIRIVADATVFGVLITFFLVNLSLIVIRKKKPDLERPFKQKPNIKWMPIIALLGCLTCFGLLFTFVDLNGLLTILIQGIIIVCGIIVFYAMKSKIETSVRKQPKEN
ncbi:MAG: APC family permease, partial [Promethearchaeota archaeon]